MQERTEVGAGKGSDTAVMEGFCPKCESALVKRTSKFGPFIGCSNYPKCRHIEKK
jgi:DNA topoisomerase-1